MSTSPKSFCFVLMPFDQSYDDVYKLGIKAACELTGIYCERVDEQVFQETILQRVYNQIAKADLIIADMSDRNPNVFYEVGYAHALGKITILLTKKAQDIPFDLKHFQHVVYDSKIALLKEELTKRLAWFVANPQVTPQVVLPFFDVFLGEHSLLKNEVTYMCGKNKVAALRLTLHNLTPYTFAPDKLQLGIITPKRYRRSRTKGADFIPLPNGTILHMLHLEDNLFPDSYASFNVTFNDSPPSGTVDLFTVRVFSELGKFDFPISIGKGTQEESHPSSAT